MSVADENHLQNGARKIHDETDSFVGLLEENNLLGAFSKCSVQEAKDRSLAISTLCAADLSFDGKTNDFLIPSPQCPEGIPVTVYIPINLGLKPAVLVYFHGVGMTWGSRKTGSDICTLIAQSASCIVVNVEYRAPPEFKFPAAFDDAMCAVRWVVFNRGLLGAKHNSSVGVFGDSGGGLIAAQIAQELSVVSFQILVYPKLNTKTESPSYNNNMNEGPLCTTEDVQRFLNDCLDDENNSMKTIDRCSPGNHKNCHKVPPAFFVIAEYDPVKDDAHEYMKTLKAAKVRTTSVTVRGTYHGFFHLPGHFKICCGKALDRVSDFIRSHSDYSNLNLLK